MGLSCSICSREDRDELEHRIVAGDAIRLIARQAGVGRDAPTRHARYNCPGN